MLMLLRYYLQEQKESELRNNVKVVAEKMTTLFNSKITTVDHTLKGARDKFCYKRFLA